MLLGCWGAWSAWWRVNKHSLLSIWCKSHTSRGGRGVALDLSVTLQVIFVTWSTCQVYSLLVTWHNWLYNHQNWLCSNLHWNSNEYIPSYVICYVAHSKGYVMEYIDVQNSYITCQISGYIKHSTRCYCYIPPLLYNTFFILIQLVIFNKTY